MSLNTKTLFRATVCAGLVLLLSRVGWSDIITLQTAHAAGEPLTASGAFINTFSFVASILASILDVFTWFLFMLLDKVLNPVWIFDLQSGPGLQNMLREIWQLCRDLVNLGLALILIAGAIMMIITSDATKVKTALPKFVMALVLVNFSWFIPRAIFDASQILTYTVYQIPSLLHADGCVLPPTDTQPERPCEIVVGYAFFNQTNFVGADGTLLDSVTGAPVSTGWSCILRPLICIQSVPIDSPEATVNAQMHTNVLNGLIVNHARLRTLIRISDPRPPGLGPAAGPALNQIAASLMFLVKIVLILGIHIAIFFPLLAMVAAFFIRIPVLWVTMAFMPLAALSYVIQMPADFDPRKLFQEQFLQAVFLPMKVAVPFTIGFIMVNAGASAQPPALFQDALPISVFSGISSLWQVMWMIISIFIIWHYSFDVLSKGGEFVAPIVGKIKALGDSTRELGKQAVLNAPVLPIPGLAGPASLADIGKSINPQTGLNQIRAGSPLKSFMENLKQSTANRAANRNGTPLEQTNKAAEFVKKTDATFRAEINQHLTITGDAGTAADVRLVRLDQALRRLRDKGGAEVRGLSDSALIDGYLRENPTALTEAQRKQLLETLRDKRPGGGTGTT